MIAMKTVEVTVTRIGKAASVRLPAETLRHYRIGGKLILEERPGEIVLRPKRTTRRKLSWKKTFAEMAAAKEDWSEWDATLGDTHEA